MHCTHSLNSEYQIKKNNPGKISKFRTHVSSCLQFALLIVISGLIVNTFSITPALAQGNLLITPKRVVFEGSKKIQDLNLANIGKDTARYALSVVEIRMKEDGSFETITEPDSGQNFASPYLRFFPRNVVLGPNESQLVKVQLSKTSGLADGEYRSHVYFRAVREEKPLGEIEARVDSGSISVSLIPVFGITIPIIIRVGNLKEETSITDLKFGMKDTTPAVEITFNRTGTMSVYGDVKVDHIAPDGTITKVGQANGVAVYTPNAQRRFMLSLKDYKAVDLKKGKLHVSFFTQSDLKPELIDDAEIILK